MAGAEEELGLGEPADGASKMCAVDREDLKLLVGDAADPGGGLRSVAIVEAGNRAAEVGEAGLADGEVGDGAKVDPGAGVGVLI